MKLKEGSSYDFKPVKTITLPGGETSLVLLGPDCNKYLLPLSYYRGYGLTDKSNIRCKVDKINCSGKVFLEPEHPYLREGESFPFTVGTACNGDDKKDVWTVSDRAGEVYFVPRSVMTGELKSGDSVMLRVERISKGKVYFEVRKADSDALAGLEEGRSYLFTVTGFETDTAGDDWFSVRDVNGHNHLINAAYYGHYGLKTGMKFTGRVIRYSPERGKSIEPDNPWYKPGETVVVTMAPCVTMDDGGLMAEVFDAKGFTHKIFLDQNPGSETFVCRVVKIKKGRPVLEKAD